MKITNNTLVGLLNVLNSYSEKKYTQKINYAITKNLMILKKEYPIYEEQLKKLFDEYKDKQVKDKNGKPKFMKNGIPVIKESAREEFENEMKELLDFQVDIDFYYIDEECFNYDDNDRYDIMSANDIGLLQTILCKPEETNEETEETDDSEEE